MQPKLPPRTVCPKCGTGYYGFVCHYCKLPAAQAGAQMARKVIK